MENTPNYDRILDNIAACQDIDKLTTFVTNAKKQNVLVVEHAALERIKLLKPQSDAGSFLAAFWDMLMQYQELLLEHRKPTLVLNKSWKLANNEGEIVALTEWIKNRNQAWALGHFLIHSPSLMTAEGLVLEFSNLFGNETITAAKLNLKQAEEKIAELH